MYVLGIDFGSDSVRCLVVDASDGRTIASASRDYPRWKAGLYCDASRNIYRQHPLDYLESMEACVLEALGEAGPGTGELVEGLSFDTTASSPVLVNRDGTPLSLLEPFAEDPDAMFVLWKDHSSIEEADRINEVAHSWREDYTRFSGGSYSCEWVWAKMLHVLKNSPHLREQAYSWVEHCDWISAVLVGRTDPLLMSRSRCVAGHKALWHESWGGLPPWDFLETVDPLLGLFKNHLFTDTVTADKKVGGLCPEWASQLGLREGIAVGLGAIDCHVGAVGAGIKPGTLVKVMGTSTCDIAVAYREGLGDRPVRGICGQVDGSVLPGLIGLEAGQSAFGDVYAWFRNLLGWTATAIGDESAAKDVILERLSSEAESIPLTGNDPVALDWFNGRRTPDADPRVKGLISGLTLATSAPAVYKSLVEATAFGSRAINERLVEEGIPFERVVAVGGISKKSPFVMRTMADVMGVPIDVLDSDQACALGAAMFASVAAGIHGSVAEAQAVMCPGIAETYSPDPERHAVFDELYSRYKKLGLFCQNS